MLVTLHGFKGLAGKIVLLCCWIICQFCYALEVQLAVDTNRDNRIDFIADEAGEDTWTIARGAIFLCNNDSDENTRLPDHSDARVNGRRDLDDLAVILLRQLPDLPVNARVTMEVDSASLSHVRIFCKNADGVYENVDLVQHNNIAADLLRLGNTEFRIEANSYADLGWTGEVRITATVETGHGVAKDVVCLRVAPFLLLSGCNRAKTVYVREYPGENDAMIAQLREIATQAEVELFVIPAGGNYPYYQIWLQDCMELGYSQSPTARLPVAFPANRNRALDEFCKSLLAPGYGWFRYSSYRPPYGKGGSGNGWLDWYGNLEVSPPLPGFPLGRIYYGGNGEASLNPQIIAMLNAQKMQGPAVRFDTGWLLIKHVDEIFCFVPSGEELHPYKVLVPDPQTAITLLQGWQQEGHGSKRLLTHFDAVTIDQLLADESLLVHNRNLQRRIEANCQIARREFGLREQDFVKIPILFHRDGRSLIPNMVNSLLLNGHILLPDPNGPVVAGVDLLQQHVRQVLAPLPLQVHFLDDRRYHKWSGNVHCGTNATREGYVGNWWDYRK